MPSTIIGLFPPPADLRFTEVSNYDTPYSLIGGFYQFDQRPYNDSDMAWQTPKPYSQKRSFTDNVTILVQTNTYDTVPLYPDLYVQPYDGSIAIPLSFSGSPFQFGAQRIAGNYYTDPVTGTQYQLDSFQWKFRFDQIVSAPTDNGIYYLKMRIYGNTAGTEYRDYVSEPIFVYTKHLYTTLIEATYNVNRKSEGIVAGGWVDGNSVTVQHRVEGFPINYEPESVNVGYLQQEYLYLQQKAQSWRTWLFAMGGVNYGVPQYMHEKVSKAFESDIWKIDGKYFSLNQTEGNSVSKLWRTTDPVASNLRWATVPIRERFSGEWVFVTETPPSALLIIDPSAYPYAVVPFSLLTDTTSTYFAQEVVNASGQTALVAYWNTLGAAGLFYEDAGKVYFAPTSGTATISTGTVEILYDFFLAEFTTSAFTATTCGYQYAGVNNKQVIDWGDGSGFDYYTNTDAYTHIVPHTYAASGTAKTARVFHSNLLGTLQFAETAYTSTSKILSISGSLPTGLGSLIITQCSRYASNTGGLAALDISMCQSLIILGINANNTSLNGFSSLFTVPMASLKYIIMGIEPLTTSAVDNLFNTFVANSWNTAITGGDFGTECAPLYPPAPPTAASLASRTALTTASWIVNTD